MAEGVERFELENDDGDAYMIVCEEGGGWVRYSDYEKVGRDRDAAYKGEEIAQRERDKARQEVLEEAREGLRLDHWIEHHRKEERSAYENCADPEVGNQHKVVREAFEDVKRVLATLDTSGEGERQKGCGGTGSTSISPAIGGVKPCPGCPECNPAIPGPAGRGQVEGIANEVQINAVLDQACSSDSSGEQGKEKVDPRLLADMLEAWSSGIRRGEALEDTNANLCADDMVRAAGILRSLPVTPAADTSKEPNSPRYTTEQARMRLRERLAKIAHSVEAPEQVHVCDPERPCEPNDHLCRNYPSSSEQGETEHVEEGQRYSLTEAVETFGPEDDPRVRLSNYKLLADAYEAVIRDFAAFRNAMHRGEAPSLVLSDKDRDRLTLIAGLLEAVIERGQLTSPIWAEETAFLRNLASQEHRG